jgi:hypothetical protein
MSPETFSSNGINSNFFLLFLLQVPTRSTAESLSRQDGSADERAAIVPLKERSTTSSPSKLKLPGTGPLIGEEPREFENLLTAGATGYSQRELSEMTEQGALLAGKLVPLQDLQATGSHLVISPDSRLLSHTLQSAARSSVSGRSSPERMVAQSPPTSSVGFVITITSFPHSVSILDLRICVWSC